VTIPEHLMRDPCEVVGPGKTVTSLKRGYVKNTSCAGKYAEVLNGIRTYNRKVSDENTELVEGEDNAR